MPLKEELKLCAFDVTWAILLLHTILVVCCSLSLTLPIYLSRLSHQETVLMLLLMVICKGVIQLPCSKKEKEIQMVLG